MSNTRIKYAAIDSCVLSLSEKIKDIEDTKNQINKVKNKYRESNSEVGNAFIDYCDKYLKVADLNVELATNLSNMLLRAKLIFENIDSEMSTSISNMISGSMRVFENADSEMLNEKNYEQKK